MDGAGAHPRPEDPASPQPPRELGLLPLRGTIIYPLTVTPLAISRPAAVRLADAVIDAGEPLGLVALRDDHSPDRVGLEAIFTIGTAAILHRMVRLSDGTLRVAAEGVERFRITAITQDAPHLRAAILPIPDPPPDDQAHAAARVVAALAVQLGRHIPAAAEAAAEIAAEPDPARVAYLAAARLLLRASLAERQAALDLPAAAERLEHVRTLLARDLAALGTQTPR